VEQQVFLFSESISENIAMGCASPPTPAEVEAVAREACIYDEVLELPSGFETPLGERGVNLSGGQKQRLALSRALVRKPSLLLLDDSFSAVDVAIEERIIENLFSKYGDLSLCFASHRLSVMPRMDEIWLIENGRVSERGTHVELLQTSALYRALWEKSEKLTEEERLVEGDLGRPAEQGRAVSDVGEQIS
jgi:ATP-binding cassette subfamily B protein